MILAGSCFYVCYALVWVRVKGKALVRLPLNGALVDVTRPVYHLLHKAL